jgi:hypothetical protein
VDALEVPLLLRRRRRRQRRHSLASYAPACSKLRTRDH